MREKPEKKAAEMGRFFASEWLREPGAQQMLIGKVNPFLKKGIDQLSTAIRPKKIIKQTEKIWMEVEFLAICFMDLTMPRGTNPVGRGAQRPQQKGKGVDIHKAIGKLPKPKGGWTLPGHNYTGPYNPLEHH